MKYSRTKNANRVSSKKNNRVVEVPESNMWASEKANANENINSGFMAFKRRIDEQLQLMDLDICVDDADLLPYYRMGESENFVLGALGCF